MFRGILMAVILLFLVGMLFLFQEKKTQKEDLNNLAAPTISPRENTLKYENEEVGMTFEYPQSLRLEDNDLENYETGGNLQLFNYSEDKYIGGEQLEEGDFKIEIVIPTKGDITLEEFVKRQVALGSNQDRDQLILQEKIGDNEWITDQIEGASDFKSFYKEMDTNKVIVVTVFPNINNLQALKTVLTTMKTD